MPYATFDDLLAHIQKDGGKRRFAVAAANSEHAVEAALAARERGIAEPILFGESETIASILLSLGHSATEVPIVNYGSPEAAAQAAMECIKNGEADFIVKGLIETGPMMKLMLNSETGIKSGPVVHSVAFAEIETYHKLLVSTDSAIVIAPDLAQKKQMIQNTVAVMKIMGWDCPKVAVLAAVEKVSSKMQATLDAAELKAMWQRGEIPDCILEGPMAFDLAISKESADIKNFHSPVAGDADMVLYPDIASGNIGIKTLTMTGHNKVGSVILGLKAPAVMSSRGSAMENKLRGILLAASMVKA